ncbi:hypothetical protein LH412_06550 [Yersinia intermedia]|uniref:hypothetical protein n=1 Tax=Yersinia intermedia TaxID=631 RepID=UPI001CFE7F52|nr:hypothetical protein [Yersinia intermedia]MCB5321694.1 hypothetical protein [Yersinia intermedia]
MVHIRDDRRIIAFFDHQLRLKDKIIPPAAHETLLNDYLKRVRHSLIRSHPEPEVDNFLNDLKNQYEQIKVTDDEIAWYKDDPRAAFWLLAKLHTTTKDEFEGGLGLFDTQPYINGNPLIYDPERRPVHALRLKNIDDFFIFWAFGRSVKKYIAECHIQWSALVRDKDIFRSINTLEDMLWVRKYLIDHHVFLKDYSCGNSEDEILAHCYASYFIWSQQSNISQSDDKLFIKKFKEAWSARKHRNKNMALNRKTINIPISEISHKRLEELAQTAGTAKNIALENAISVAWEIMRSK